MKEELLKQIIPIVEMTKDGIIKAAELVQVEAPLVVAEIYKWEFLKSSLIFWGCVGLAILCVILIILLCVTDGEEALPVPIIGLFVFILFASFNMQWIQIKIAPKLFLIEYLSNLIK